MATPQEKSTLSSRGGDDGERRTIAAQVDRLVRARLKDAFRKDAGVNVSPGSGEEGADGEYCIISYIRAKEGSQR